MMKIRFPIAALAVFALAGCQTVGQLTIRDYTASDGQHVLIGQAEPKADYGCTQVAQEKEAWGLTGNMDKAAALERMREVALENMPKKSANYGYLMAPAETGIMGFNVSAFRDAQIAYYRCSNLPAKS